MRSSQTGAHPNLPSVVLRHCATAWRGELHQPTVAAFRALQSQLSADDLQRIILDSGCGNGSSTRLIAEQFPDSIVIGVDRSAKRLRAATHGPLPRREGNAFRVRAELASFWWLARDAGWRVQRHFLLYPNPWPKPSQLRRRWHGHPVFPTLLALEGQLELRANWLPYAEEFAAAMQLASGKQAVVKPVDDSPITSPFELKYRRSGHALYRVLVDLRSTG